MASILGLSHLNTNSTSLSKIVSTYGGEFFVYSPGTNTWTGQSFAVSTTEKVEMEMYLDKLWCVNGNDATRSYDGTTWTVPTDIPIAKYIKRYLSRLYLGYCTYPAGTIWPSRVFYSDLPENNVLKWGLESGSDLVQTTNTSTITSAGSTFITNNIEVGDPFFITSGTNTGTYTIAVVDSETQLTLVETLPYTQSGCTFWCGDNWFDVNTDDGDFVNGMGENSNRLLVFKQDSLYRYGDGVLSKCEVPTGTISNRSVANLRGYTLWFGRDGIYRYNGVSGEIVSNGIVDYIEGIAGSSFSNIAATTKDNHYYAIMGTLTNSDEDISITNAMVDYDISQDNFHFLSLAHTPKVFSSFIENGVRNLYFGTDNAKVFQLFSGNADGGVAIPVSVVTKQYFPSGPEYLNTFKKILVFSTNGMGVNIQYKILGNPDSKKDSWTNVGSIHQDYFEIELNPSISRGRGIQFRFSESSTNEPFVIEGISVFYVPDEKVK